ncbi:PucR family transcriptional regulator, partial [Streptomyces sp. SID10244]|nr:PucR family transcriptional regulator [Streptomyces sp. SID10244]
DADIEAGLTELGSVFDHRVGVSGPFSMPSEIARAVDEARLARRSVPPGAATLSRYESLTLALLLVRSPDTAREVAARTLGPLLDLPEDEREEMLA